MAITIKIEPQILQPTYNENIIVLKSTNVTERAFNFIVEINTGKTSNNLVNTSRLKMPGNLESFGVFDIHKHLEQFVTSDLNFDSTLAFNRMPNSYIFYNVSLKEEYDFKWRFTDSYNQGGFMTFFGFTDHHFNVGDIINIQQDSPIFHTEYDGAHKMTAFVTSSGFLTDIRYISATTSNQPGTASLASNSPVEITDSATFSEVKIGFNGVLPWLDVNSYDAISYTPTDSSSKLLTEIQPNIYYKVDLDDRVTYNVYNPATASSMINYMTVVSNKGVFKITNPFNLNIDNNKLISAGVGPYNLLNTVTSITTVSGSLPILDSSTGTYSVQMTNETLGPKSDIYLFKIVDRCSIFETFKFIFLDKMGSFITSTFNRVSKNEIKIKRTKYKKNYGNYNATTNTWGYNSYDRGDTILDVDIANSIKVNSDWVDENQVSIIKSLIESPEVYHLDETGLLRSIQITTSTFESKKKVNEQIFNYTLTFEYGYKNTVQRG